MPAVRLILAAALGLAAAPVLAQGGPDELWNMTTRMEMAGMPAQAMTQPVCMKKGQAQPDKMSQDKNCKVTDVRTVGNKTSWKVVCTGRDAMSGTGEITRTRDSMDGRIRLQGKSDGETMDMTMVMSGKLAGGCNAGDQDKKMQAMVAQGNAQVVQMCTDAMNSYQSYMFEGEDAICKAQKSEFCARATKTTQTMRTPAGYRKSAKAADWDQVDKVCKVNLASVRASACKSATGGRDWDFVGEHCPAEAKAIAAEHCAGRSYTVVMASEYKGVCSRYASRDAAPTPTDAVKDGVKEGARALRKLFGR